MIGSGDGMDPIKSDLLSSHGSHCVIAAILVVMYMVSSLFWALPIISCVP